MHSVETRFAAIVESLLTNPGVTYGSGETKSFGSAGLKIDNKIFAMVVRGKLVVKLPKQRVDKLIAAGHGHSFDIGQNRIREWLAVPATSEADWLMLVEEAMAYVDTRR